jgi:hypothetical protein
MVEERSDLTYMTPEKIIKIVQDCNTWAKLDSSFELLIDDEFYVPVEAVDLMLKIDDRPLNLKSGIWLSQIKDEGKLSHENVFDEIRRAKKVSIRLIIKSERFHELQLGNEIMARVFDAPTLGKFFLPLKYKRPFFVLTFHITLRPKEIKEASV